MPPSKRRELKKDLGLPPDEPYILPSFGGEMEHLQDESLMLFSYSYKKKKRYKLFYGIGIVYRVVKGDKQDLIYINFGFFRTSKPRLVVAYDNHSRRQTLTLKRGQVCQVYGIARYFNKKQMINGVMTNCVQIALYARGLLGWYVPTVMDIKKMPINEDVVDPSEKEKDLQQTFEDVLNEFMTGEKEENYD